MEEGPPAKKRRVTGGFIKVVVGQTAPETLTVHETLLREGTTFFNAALSKQWKEGQERKIELPEDDPDVVATYLEWLYTEKLYPVPECKTGRHTVQSFKAATALLFGLYVFGEKYQDTCLCNAVIASYTEMFDTKGVSGKWCPLPGAQSTRIIYDGTPDSSPARKMLVYIYSKFSTRKTFAVQVEGRKKEDWLGVPELLFDLAIARMAEVAELKSETTNISDTKVMWFK